MLSQTLQWINFSAIQQKQALQKLPVIHLGMAAKQQWQGRVPGRRTARIAEGGGPHHHHGQKPSGIEPAA
jgi:hypothetical protein